MTALKLDMGKFRDDLKNEKIVADCMGTYAGAHFNVTRYIFNYQENTKMWHFVNRDVGINLYHNNGAPYMEIDGYGKSIPDWAYNVIKDMEKVLNQEQIFKGEF